MKQNAKKILVLLLAAILIFTVIGCSKPTASDDEKTIACTITIDATTAYDNSDLDDAIREVLANDGLLIDGTQFDIPEESTATTLLNTACRELKIPADIQNGEYGAYIQGIGGLSNGACGDMSYWLLKVNGEFAEVGSDSITVNEGDEIVWIFTCDGGADVGYVWSTVED